MGVSNEARIIVALVFFTFRSRGPIWGHVDAQGIIEKFRKKFEVFRSWVKNTELAVDPMRQELRLPRPPFIQVPKIRKRKRSERNYHRKLGANSNLCVDAINHCNTVDNRVQAFLEFKEKNSDVFFLTVDKSSDIALVCKSDYQKKLPTLFKADNFEQVQTRRTRRTKKASRLAF